MTAKKKIKRKEKKTPVHTKEYKRIRDALKRLGRLR